MKLHSIEQARSIWLFPTVDINPTGKFLLTAVAELAKRYKFANLPNVVEAIKKNEGIQFGSGAYMHSTHGEIQADFGFYNDGLIGDTRNSTEATDDFLHDVLTWGQKEHGLKYPISIRKQYASKVHVESKKRLSALNPKLTKFSKAITEKCAFFGNVSYELNGINFTTEQASKTAPPIFRFERSEVVPYSDNRYYSFAGMPTEDHLELLDKLEEILS